MSSSIYLSLESEARIFLYLDVIFGVSLSLHSLSLYLLIKRTPPNQMVVRNYLIVLLLVHDTHLDVGIHPIIVLQALGGYGTGLLLRAGVPLSVTFGCIVNIWISIAIAIIMCIVHRHQTVVLPGNTFKFRKAGVSLQTRVAVSVVLAIISPIPAIIWMATTHGPADPRNISWIRDRGYFYIEERVPIVIFAMCCCAAFLFLFTFTCVLIFGHMFYTLRIDSVKRSSRSIKFITRSLLNLFAQLVIPLFLFVVPTLLCAFAVIFPDFISFETNQIVYIVIPTHSIGHNLILLTVNSAYRKLFTAVCQKTTGHTVSVITSVPVTST